jgi:hypothetical protein
MAKRDPIKMLSFIGRDLPFQIMKTLIDGGRIAFIFA